jgi:hypothetical protein
MKFSELLERDVLNEVEQSIKGFAQASGKSEAEVKEMWSKAAGMAKADGKSDNFAYVASIVKGMLDIKD